MHGRHPAQAAPEDPSRRGPVVLRYDRSTGSARCALRARSWTRSCSWAATCADAERDRAQREAAVSLSASPVPRISSAGLPGRFRSTIFWSCGDSCGCARSSLRWKAMTKARHVLRRPLRGLGRGRGVDHEADAQSRLSPLSHLGVDVFAEASWEHLRGGVAADPGGGDAVKGRLQHRTRRMAAVHHHDVGPGRGPRETGRRFSTPGGHAGAHEHGDAHRDEQAAFGRFPTPRAEFRRGVNRGAARHARMLLSHLVSPSMAAGLRLSLPNGERQESRHPRAGESEGSRDCRACAIRLSAPRGLADPQWSSAPRSGGERRGVSGGAHSDRSEQ